ncbi:ELOF1 [Hepatospora eriocheir]|uniref:Transcription elongation factor 1 homolog n=1 Tax=Hepatospora eriocheir TaxID=1081669 RepID=A0A1X0QLG2_9MICR|nr:ELOF1 [Hepatospora eriocheir]
MTKRRSKRKPIVKRKTSAILDKKFNCPVCNHEKVVTCKISKTNMKGFAKCCVCNFIYKCDVSKIDQNIDVYNKWIDSINLKELPRTAEDE